MTYQQDAHQKDERGDPVTRTHEPARKNFSAREARQAGPGRPVLKVLGISLVLAFLVWGAVEIWGQRIDPSAPVDATQTSATQDTATESVPGGGETVPTDRDPTPDSGTGGESQRVTPDGTAN